MITQQTLTHTDILLQENHLQYQFSKKIFEINQVPFPNNYPQHNDICLLDTEVPYINAPILEPDLSTNTKPEEDYDLINFIDEIENIDSISYTSSSLPRKDPILDTPNELLSPILKPTTPLQDHFTDFIN